MASFVTSLVECLTDSASLGMNLIATFTVLYGSYRTANTPGWSAAADQGSPGSADETGRSSWLHAIALPLFGSLVLLAYRYFFRYFEMLLMIALTILCGSCFFVMIYPPMRWLERRFFSTVFAHGSLVAPIGAFTGSVLVVSRWLTTAHWVYADALAISTAVSLIDSVRMPSARGAILLLCGFLLYDTFWVLLLPLVVHDNIMADVAWQRADNPLTWLLHTTGFQLALPPVAVPITLHVPSMELPHEIAVLGLADVVLPALFAVYCLRCDHTLQRLRPSSSAPSTSGTLRGAQWWHRHFPRAMVGYFLGLFLAMYASAVFRAAQPVLLYVVPLLVALPSSLARRQGHWDAFWRGTLLLPHEAELPTR